MTVEQPEGGRDELADLRAEVEADRCGASWYSNPVVSWTCGLPNGHEGAHLSLVSPERFQGPEYMRMGS